LLVLNMILGGQFVSRINLNLREDKGYTYGARSFFDLRVGRGPFLVQTSVQTAVTAAAIQEIRDEIDAIRGRRPPTHEELDTARAALTRGYPRGFETGEQTARSMTQLALYDLPDDYFARFMPAVAAVDAAAVTRVAETYLDPTRLTTLIVGDRAGLAPSLEAASLGQPELVEIP
jgi:predicted Zn-dependent peptidase